VSLHPPAAERINAEHGDADSLHFRSPGNSSRGATARDSRLRLNTCPCSQVAWIHVGRQMLLTVHKHVVVKVPRFSVSHDNQKTWLLHISSVQQDDRGYYMCQVNTNPMISQVGFLQVVGKYAL